MWMSELTKNTATADRMIGSHSETSGTIGSPRQVDGCCYSTQHDKIDRGLRIPNKRDDVAVRILEPGEPQPACVVDVTGYGSAGKIVVLERDAFRLEIAHDLFDVAAHGPRDRRRLVRPGKLRNVNEKL